MNENWRLAGGKNYFQAVTNKKGELKGFVTGTKEEIQTKIRMLGYTAYGHVCRCPCSLKQKT